MSDLPSSLARLEKADLELGRRMAGERHEPAVKAAAKAGKLGDQEPLYLISAGVAAAGLLSRRPRLFMAGVRMGAAVAAADLIKSLVKRGVTRTRPHVLLDEGRYERDLGGAEDKPEQSFPSGHMACTTAAACALARAYPATWPAGLVAALGLGWSRIKKGAHWPLDVAAGAVIGLVAEPLSALAIALLKSPWRR
jgi:membrane-associated phospholipid phosphatase